MPSERGIRRPAVYTVCCEQLRIDAELTTYSDLHHPDIGRCLPPPNAGDERLIFEAQQRGPVDAHPRSRHRSKLGV